MKLQRTGRLAALLAASTLALTACASDDDQGAPAAAAAGSAAPTVTGTLAGAGSSAQTAAMEAWIAGFQGENPDVTVNYDAVGSGAGREQFVAGQALGFAGSDAALNDEELAAATTRCGGDAADRGAGLHQPDRAWPSTCRASTTLKLSAENIANIFNQKITNWNDPALADGQPGPARPGHHAGQPPGQVRHDRELHRLPGRGRPDGVAVRGLRRLARQGRARPATAPPASSRRQGRRGCHRLRSTRARSATSAWRRSRSASEFVELSAEGAAAVVGRVARAPRAAAPTDLALDLKRDLPGTYPIVLVSYADRLHASTRTPPRRSSSSPSSATSPARTGQQAAAEAAGSAPLPTSLRADVEAAIESIADRLTRLCPCATGSGRPSQAARAPRVRCAPCRTSSRRDRS